MCDDRNVGRAGPSGQAAHRLSKRLSRRGLLHTAATGAFAAAISGPLLNACALRPGEPSSPQSGVAGERPASTAGAIGPLPAFIPQTTGPQPDYRGPDSRVVHGYEHNPTWQEVNRRLNADLRMNIIPATDWRTKFATVMAGGDLPDIIHIYFG